MPMATRAEIEAIKAQQKADLAKQKEEEAAAAAKAAEGSDDNKGEGANGEGGDSGNNNDTAIDYEAESNAYKERAEKAEKELAEKRFKEAEARRKAGKPAEGEGTNEDATDDEDDKPLTRREMRELLEKNQQENRRTLQSEEAKKKIAAITKSPAEASLVSEIHRTHTFPSWMPLDEQIEEAYAIANRKAFIQREAELKRALQGKQTTTTDDTTTQRDSGGAGEPKLAPQDAAAIKQSGMSWNGTKRVYEKKLSSGRTLYYDPKSGKRWAQ